MPSPVDEMDRGSSKNPLTGQINNPLIFSKTIIPGGTTGPQTINKPEGTINIAAAGASVVLTNSLITANSVVLAVLRTNDATAKSVNAVPAGGSCTFNLNAAATAEVSIGWVVFN